MKVKLILTTAIVGGALALPSVSSAAPPPPPQLDTAMATGSSNGAAGSTFSNIHVDAHSGPSGENPGGSVSFDSTAEFQRPGGILTIPFRVSGPVTCLNVTGNEAVIKINATVELFGVESPAVWEINLVDNGGSGLDTFGSPQGNNDPTDCSGGSVLGFPLFVGRAVVFDAKPLPTTKDQCKGDGWKQFGFENLGQCIAFVNHAT
jgi:hypothetical protein